MHCAGCPMRDFIIILLLALPFVLVGSMIGVLIVQIGNQTGRPRT
jgi:type III secretory pathway component EscS